MLKGHTKIEMYDTHTGKMEQIESDNMFTDAISKLVNQRGLVQYFDQTVASNIMPLHDKGIHGILLFPDKLEESVSNVYPKTAFMAHAGSDTGVGSDIHKGAFNETESGPVTNGYKYVWDFTTSQGNGTIACLCLTYTKFGNDCMKSEDSTFIGGTPTLYYETGVTLKAGMDDFYYNVPKGCVLSSDKDYAVIAFPAGSETSAGTKKSIAVVKLHLSVNAIGLDTTQSIRSELVKQIMFPEFDGNDGICFYHNGLVYFAVRHDTTALNLYKVNIDSATMETNTITISGLPNYIRKSNSFYKNGYFYVLRTVDGTTYLTKINLSNYADITDILQTKVTGCNLRYMDRIKTARLQGVGILFEDDSLYEDASTLGMAEGMGNYDHFAYSSDVFTKDLYGVGTYEYYRYGSGNYSGTFQNLFDGYLATINNLPSPVTKTADQTMKITYTVTES